MRRVRLVATTAFVAALVTSCVRPVDVEPTDSGSAGPGRSTSTQTSTSGTSTSPSPSLHQTEVPGTLRVAITFDQPGVGLREGDSYSGLDVDIARYVARHMGISRISFVEAVTDQRETLLATGQADLVLASYSMTPEREKRVAFAGPYLTTGQDLLVSSRSSIRRPSQLRGFTVCSVQGSSSTAELVDDYPGLHLTVQPRVSDCVKLLTEGKVKAVTSDAAILSGYARASRAPDKLRISNRPFAREQWGVAVRRDQTALCQDVRDALADMVETGAWTRAVTDNLGSPAVAGRRTHTPPKLQACPRVRTDTSTSGSATPSSS